MRGHASTTFILVFGLLISLPAASARAGNHVEGVNGDISDNGAAPTNLTLGNGANIVSGAFGSPDTDILHVNIPAGLQLSSITLTSYGVGDLSFIGVKSGSTWSGNPNFDGVTQGYVHISPGHVGSDVLDDIAASPVAGAVTPPLTGDYTFWMQNATTPNTSYSLSFNVVPEPGALGLLALAGVALLNRRRPA